MRGHSASQSDIFCRYNFRQMMIATRVAVMSEVTSRAGWGQCRGGSSSCNMVATVEWGMHQNYSRRGKRISRTDKSTIHCQTMRSKPPENIGLYTSPILKAGCSPTSNSLCECTSGSHTNRANTRYIAIHVQWQGGIRCRPPRIFDDTRGT